MVFRSTFAINEQPLVRFRFPHRPQDVMLSLRKHTGISALKQKIFWMSNSSQFSIAAFFQAASAHRVPKNVDVGATPTV
jgi:hypothetical protein